MIVRITTDVFCDGCGRWDHYRVSAKAHVREAQQAAKASGWTVDRKGDCKCPECNGSKERHQYWGYNSQPHTLKRPQ